MGPPELESEEQENFLDDPADGKVIMKVFLQEEDDEFQAWMQTIHVHCTRDGKEIWRGIGRYVKRDYIRSHFWRDMEEPCQELSSIAFELFDRYGRLKSEFIDHTIRKGTGCWGSELDLGSLFVIEYMSVEKALRRKGVGKRMATCLLNKALAGERKTAFSLVMPGWLNSDISKVIDGKSKREQIIIRRGARSSAIAFYRSLGFRRIGASYCFGLATDPDHQACKLLAAADFDPPEAEVEEDDTNAGNAVEPILRYFLGDQHISSPELERLKARLPLHHATMTMPDDECADFYAKFKEGHAAQDWGQVDRYHKNVLHLAACKVKVKCVKWLLQNADEGHVLSSARSIEGYTPLEQLESLLETKRTTLEHGLMTVCISDRFTGFGVEAVACPAALHGITSPTDVQLARLRFGCTCGKCIQGLLSPRMKFALLCEAEMTHDMLSDMLSGFISDGEDWCVFHEDLIAHVAPDIQRNFRTNKSLRQGFANIFDHAAEALRANAVPNAQNVLKAWENSSEWLPVTRNFYTRGGRPENVLPVIFELAREEDKWAGNSVFMAMSGEELFAEEIAKLPKCRNDHEYGCVALACGLSELQGLDY
jgi:GNAT superfamily N-acetyltransferase